MTLTEGPLGFPMPDKTARAVDALLQDAAENQGLRVPQGARRPAADRAEPRRTQRRVVDLDRERGPHGRGRRRPGHERRPVPAEPARHARPCVLDAAGGKIAVAQARQGRRPGRHQGQDAVPAAAGVVAGRRRVAARQGAGAGPGRAAPGQEHRLSADARPRPRHEGGRPSAAGATASGWSSTNGCCWNTPASSCRRTRTPWSRRCRRAPSALDAELLRALGVDAATLLRDRCAAEAIADMAFTPLAEVERAAARAVEAVDWAAFAARRVAERIDRLRGRV